MQLTRREKRVVLIAAALLIMFAVFHMVVRPAMHRVQTLRRVLKQKRGDLARLRAKSREYVALRDELAEMRSKIARQGKSFRILSFLEGVGKSCGLTQHIAYMKPTTSAVGGTYQATNVEIKFENVSLEQITQFLIRVESSEALIGVKSVHITKATKSPAYLDVVLDLSTLARVNAG